MRLLVLIAAGIGLLLVLAGNLRFWLGSVKSDAAGQGMAQAYVVIGTLVAIILLAPVFALAYHNQWLWPAMILAVLVGFFALVALIAGS